MLKRVIPVFLGVALLISACGAQGTPTLSLADTQGTAMAAALTIVAATQQAIPTATPLPPTETPSPTLPPTFTPLPLPTLPEVSLPTPTTAAAAGDCLGPINFGEAGPTVKVRIENTTKGKVTLSLNLWTKNLFGQCGAVSYIVSKFEKKIISLPKGQWWAYGWIDYGKSSSTASCSFELRVADEDLMRLLVSEESCRVIGA